MTWIQHHTESERLASDAEVAARNGDILKAHSFYIQAAEAEEKALADLEPTKLRTLGISAVSTVSLYYKGANTKEAERVAYQWLSSSVLPDFAAEQVRGLLQSIWSEHVRRRSNVDFVPGQVIVSVKGGEIIEGGAPLDLILEKVQTVQSLYYRTAELLLNLPHRKRGGPTKEVVETCRPWLFQTSPGSYQFAVAVQEPRQRRLFDTNEPHPQEVADQFLKILRASVEAPEDELPTLVPDSEYRKTFLKLTRNLAPTGKRFSQLEVRSAAETRAVSLSPDTRTVVGQAIRATQPAMPSAGEQEQTIRGILRALHLDRDWIEVTVDTVPVHITNVGDAIDDVIGPMVNHPVVVQVMRDTHGKLHFRDIETDD
jgi:hypothetical protein